MSIASVAESPRACDRVFILVEYYYSWPADMEINVKFRPRTDRRAMTMHNENTTYKYEWCSLCALVTQLGHEVAGYQKTYEGQQDKNAMKTCMRRLLERLVIPNSLHTERIPSTSKQGKLKRSQTLLGYLLRAARCDRTVRPQRYLTRGHLGN